MVFEAVEQTKKQLSSELAAQFAFHVPGIDIDQAFTRAEFELGARRELGAIVAALDATLQQAGVAADAVDLVCLTGGTARVPRVRQALTERFGAERLHSSSSLHAVVDGLAQHARWLLDPMTRGSCPRREGPSARVAKDPEQQRTPEYWAHPGDGLFCPRRAHESRIELAELRYSPAPG